jgi:hypothetical protein
MAMQVIERPDDSAVGELREMENAAPANADRAAAAEPSVPSGGNRPLGRIGGLALALRGWLSGPPVSQRDRAMSAANYGEHNWVNYW